MKEFLIFIMISCIIFCQTGCETDHTSSLWEKKYQNDKIISLLVSQDGKTLVAIGEKYHYMFPMSSTLEKVIKWPEHAKVEPYDFQGKIEQIDYEEYQKKIIC